MKLEQEVFLASMQRKPEEQALEFRSSDMSNDNEMVRNSE